MSGSPEILLKLEVPSAGAISPTRDPVTCDAVNSICNHCPNAEACLGLLYLDVSMPDAKPSTITLVSQASPPSSNHGCW
jgi:hypothetical protein